MQTDLMALVSTIRLDRARRFATPVEYARSVFSSCAFVIR
jgi:hypothetical protein